jgi:hypothetical protein
VEGASVGRLRGLEDGSAVEIGRFQADGLVRLLDEGGICVGIDVHGHAADPHLVGTAHDAAGDFPTVCDE